MTSDELAEFVMSPEGQVWGRYCAHYDLHPGAAFSDDVTRFQAGIAYMMLAALEQNQKETEAPHPDLARFVP